MKAIVRLFFKTLRIVLGPFMLLWELLTRPKGLVRPPALQAQVDEQCRSLVLYQFKTCPFCIKVRQEMRRLSLDIERRDAQGEGPHRDALVAGGGRAMVPCLKIADQAGHSQWLYESGAIIEYLRGRFANT
ncbi:MAG: glutathione S-transferase N-terminal domain-containing protein [Rhodocyclaceae bacterium]|nr:glutathione S-transferase N-terminal domain-containing protein [Rhodocyclaceae bacterium]